MSREDLDCYRQMCYQQFGAQKYEYCHQISTLNHFVNHKGVWYQLRRELLHPEHALKPDSGREEIPHQNETSTQVHAVSWDVAKSLDLPKEHLMRQLLIADRSITQKSMEQSSESSESMEGSSLEESMQLQSSTSVESSQQRDNALTATSVAERSTLSVKIKQGEVRITSRNLQLVLKVLSAIKNKSVPPQVYEFMSKIVDSLKDIEFRVISESHREKIKHLFYFKLFKYVGFALKNLQENSETETFSTLAINFNSYIRETVNENVSHVLENPRIYAGSVGYVAGLSWCLKYLEDSTVNEVVSAIKRNNFLDRNYFHEVVPLCISIVENFENKFTNDEKSEMIKNWLNNTKSANKNSKKLYLSLQLLFSKEKGKSTLIGDNSEKFSMKVFFKSKRLAKIFIRYFISNFYHSNSSEGQQNVDLLIQILKEKQGESVAKSKRYRSILNYIFSEILSYDIMKQNGESFENMNMYSVINDIFQNSGTIDEESEVENPHRQINFFLQIYEKCISFLSLHSPDSIATSLGMMLSSSRNSSLFKAKPKLYEHKIVDKLYYCALISYSTEVIDLIFTELGKISISLVESGQNLTVISDTIFRHQNTLCFSEMKEELCWSLLTLLSSLMGHILKKDYKTYMAGEGVENLQMYSSLIRCLFDPIVDTWYKALHSENKNPVKIEFQWNLTKIIRDIWGYSLIFRGLSEVDVNFNDLFDPDQFCSLELMKLAYFITPPLIIPQTEDEPNSLLEPQFPPEMVLLLKEPITNYFARKYPKQKKSFQKLPEDMMIILGEIEFVLSNQIVYLKNWSNDEWAEMLPLPHVVSDIFYYLQHEDVNALDDLVNVMVAQSHNFLEMFHDIVLEAEKASSFIKNWVSNSFSLFILNIWENWKYVDRMIDEFPYLFLWKPALMSFITMIDKLALSKYLEFGNSLNISYVLRNALSNSKNSDPFEGLLSMCKRLTWFALISNHSAFKMTLESIQSENSRQQGLQVSVETSVSDFTVKLIKKWISEFTPTQDEYKLKMQMVLKEGESPTKISEKTINSFFLSSVSSENFLQDPLTILSFDHSVLVPSMKSIFYFIGLTKNLLNFEEHHMKYQNHIDVTKLQDITAYSREKGSGSQSAVRDINLDKIICDICQRIKSSLMYQNHSDAYTHFMTLQCLYLILKQSQRISTKFDSTIRELMNLIVINASLDTHGSLLFGFTQLVQHLQQNDRSSEADLFTDLMFGYQSWQSAFNTCFNPNTEISKFVPSILKIYDQFDTRYTKQLNANVALYKESRSCDLGEGSAQFLMPESTSQLSSKLQKISSLSWYAHLSIREKQMSSKELCNFFEIQLMYIKSCLVRNTTYKKRTNLASLFKTITKLWSLDISKLIRIDSAKETTEVSYAKLIQLFSVIVDFCFEWLLCISQLWEGIAGYTRIGKEVLMEGEEDSTLLSTATVGLVKMIMHVWINLSSIKHYERYDQFKKMVNLLKGIFELVDRKGAFKEPMIVHPNLYVVRMDLAHKYLTRRFLSATDTEFEYYKPDYWQSISVSWDRRSSHNQTFIYDLSDEFFNEEYKYVKDLKFVLSCWIDELYAQNYHQGWPKKYPISSLVKENRMIYYYPTVALQIYSHCPRHISEKYNSAFKKFSLNCENAVFENPKNFTNNMHALLIYTDKEKDNIQRNSNTREFKDVMNLWKCYDMAVALRFLNRDYDNYSTLHTLSLQYLNYASLDTLLFLSSELFQALRTYTDNKVEDFLVNISRKWPSLTHRIIWMAQVELKPTEDKKARKVKLGREDTLPEICDRIIKRILGNLTKYEKQLFDRESHFFENITHISSILNPKMSKDEKRRIIKDQLIELNQEIPEGVYLPNNPSYIVQSIVETSGTPMQSAEKCPILVAFRVIEKKSMHDILVEEKTVPDEVIDTSIEEEKIGRLSTAINRPGRLSEESFFERMIGDDESEDDGVFHSHRNALRESFKRNITKNASFITKNSFKNLNSILNQHHFKRTNSAFDNSKNKITMKPETRFTGVLDQIKGVDKAAKKIKQKSKEKIVACIFKTKDDVRQDILALKIVKLFKDIFKTYQLSLHLVPYNVICNRTGDDSSIGGIIECIPNCHSRDELGKDYDVDMYQYFIEKFGWEESSKFKKAQLNFIRSLAGYSIFSYIVQTKDRHNGNIMIDAEGNIIHIDFGFIFDWSPGGDMRFETADFKFTKEMIKILGNDKKAPGYQLFVRNAIQGFLAVRKFAKQICDLVYFSYHSGLPCFKERSMRLLKKRFRSELSECEAAEVMRKIINNAHKKWTTKVYDQVQYIQNKIAY